MTRHGKNATASAVYSYHEKKKDTEQSTYGTQAARLGKDSVKDFDACCLTLQPCRNPVVTPHGYLYEKQAILEYIIHQKREIAKQAKQYEKQKRRDEKELKELAEAETKSKVNRFIKTEKAIVSKTVDAFKDDKKPKDIPSCSNMENGKSKDLPSFWIPSLTPAANKSKVSKPNSKVFCPMSKKPIKMKDLIPVKFTPIADRDKKTSVIAKQSRWMCAVTHDTLGNFVPCAVLKPTGDVVTIECINKVIRKNNMLHPVTGQKLNESDIIELVRGGTGFASTNQELDAKSYRPVLMA
uniref:Nitric oxide synthase-interacting protein n=1 Tax=Phallusia mammillata TaxID=59560 RepID=A0A6F9DN33_9ASCI|nr:nitric oxide synthase-interacting protein [Phallusia mammillata]